MRKTKTDGSDYGVREGYIVMAINSKPTLIG
jgi:hypothetical protein